ncbi:MAG: dimethylarginine dimethylaminohydrolase family protein [Dehalococcoidia bacterium]
MVREIKRILLKNPQSAFIDQQSIDGQWQELHYRDRPDFEKAIVEYESFVGLLSQFGMEINYLPRDPDTGLDSIYPSDAFIVSNRGAVLCNMGKEARRGEPRAARAFLEQNGVPILGQVTGEGHLEGGDVVWIDERTVAVGQGYRSNAEGISQLRALLRSGVDEVISVPLPHWHGPNDVLHLLSFVSPIDHDLFLVYSRMMPVPFRQWLLERGIKLIEVPDGEYDSMACNVLAVAPRKCIMLDGNPQTRALLENEGVEVLTYEGEEISRKGCGGPTCLAQPISRV